MVSTQHSPVVSCRVHEDLVHCQTICTPHLPPLDVGMHFDWQLHWPCRGFEWLVSCIHTVNTEHTSSFKNSIDFSSSAGEQNGTLQYHKKTLLLSLHHLIFLLLCALNTTLNVQWFHSSHCFLLIPHILLTQLKPWIFTYVTLGRCMGIDTHLCVSPGTRPALSFSF